MLVFVLGEIQKMTENFSLSSVCRKSHSKEWLFCIKYGIMEVEKSEVKDMLSKGQNGRGQMEMVWLEELVPKNHLLRLID